MTYNVFGGTLNLAQSNPPGGCFARLLSVCTCMSVCLPVYDYMNKKLSYRGEHSASDFGTNRKLISDFLLVTNTNLHPILHRFQVMADYWSNFR